MKNIPENNHPVNPRDKFRQAFGYDWHRVLKSERFSTSRSLKRLSSNVELRRGKCRAFGPFVRPPLFSSMSRLSRYSRLLLQVCVEAYKQLGVGRSTFSVRKRPINGKSNVKIERFMAYQVTPIKRPRTTFLLHQTLVKNFLPHCFPLSRPRRALDRNQRESVSKNTFCNSKCKHKSKPESRLSMACKHLIQTPHHYSNTVVKAQREPYLSASVNSIT